MKVWDKRFRSREANPLLEAFNASILDDRFLFTEEVDASKAYARALHRASFLTQDELDKIESGLDTVQENIESGEDLCPFEDIHSAVELLLMKKIGDKGKKLHTGRSRNEQVVTDERLYLKRKMPDILERIREVQRTIIRLAEENPDVVMPGYTHLQQGQCVLFSHYIMALFWPLERAKSRLRESLVRTDVLPLGVGALAGSTIPLDRDFLREVLGFQSISENSMDTVSDRSFILETLFVLALLWLDLSRFAEDVVLFTSQEFGYLEMDDSICTSSSLMPQKKNPDIFELIRAGVGRFFGYVSQLFTVMKGLPSTYNKDLQEDKIPLRRGIEETLEMLQVFHTALKAIRPVRDRMREKLNPSLFATDLVDYLTEKGVAFRDAHGMIGEIVRFAERNHKQLSDVSLEEFQTFSPLFKKDVTLLFDPMRSTMKKKTVGSTHPEFVRRQIEKAKRLVNWEIESPKGKGG